MDTHAITQIMMRPIGIVRSSRSKLEDDHWDQVRASIVLDPIRFNASALEGLASFSHVEVIFYMNQVSPDQIETGARHPRGNPAWPRVGIFAQRAKNRPNPIGTTICRIQSIEGTTLHLSGLDAVDGTSVLDLKPWVSEFGPRGDLKQPAWISELMKDYWA